MQCPSCKDVSLVMSERQGVEIDYCPKCRGIWLDRGELDKLIEQSERLLTAARGTAAAPPPPPQQAYPQQPPPPQYGQPQQPYPPQPPYPQQQPPPFQYRQDLDDSKYGYQHKKRKSFWSEIFD